MSRSAALLPSLNWPADGNIEANGEAGEVARTAAAAQQDDFVKLEPERFKQFLCLLGAVAARLEVGQQIRQHVLVETPR